VLAEEVRSIQGNPLSFPVQVSLATKEFRCSGGWALKVNSVYSKNVFLGDLWRMSARAVVRQEEFIVPGVFHYTTERVHGAIIPQYVEEDPACPIVYFDHAYKPAMDVIKVAGLFLLPLRARPFRVSCDW
jgi:hypothetical protein